MQATFPLWKRGSAIENIPSPTRLRKYFSTVPRLQNVTAIVFFYSELVERCRNQVLSGDVEVKDNL